MNAAQRMIITEMIDALQHTILVYTSMADRGRYPEELCPIQLSPPFSDQNPLFLGRAGFIHLRQAIQAGNELLKMDEKGDAPCTPTN